MIAEPAPEPRYRDADAPVGERVDHLLELMTLDEKLAQLGSAWVFEVVRDKQLSPADAERVLSRGIGHITRIGGASNLGPADAARAGNEIQRFLVEHTRLGIPAILHEEVCSGLMARDATIFPQAIGVASTWDPALAKAMAAAIRSEMLAVGARQGLAPVLDVTRDPRWGRTEETFGEDPHLVAVLGAAFVRGLQGDDLTRGVVATGKHLVGYGASEGGLNWAPVRIPLRELHDVYLHPFEAAVAAGLRSVMPAYHEIDGIPLSADHELVESLLRDRWGFEGTVVSDYFAVRQLVDYHEFTSDPSVAARMALEAGIDVELPGTDCYGTPLREALADGSVTEAALDRAVGRVLTTKFELGLFEVPYVEVPTGPSPTPEHRQLARTLAQESLVLLSNDGHLPLGGGKVAVIGPNADEWRHLFGDYTYPSHVESLLEMSEGENVFSIPIPDDMAFTSGGEGVRTIREALAARLDDVSYVQGCDVNSDRTDGFAEAVTLAERADVAVLVMGDKAGLSNDSTSGESRDRVSLELPGVQEDLVRAVAGTGTPVVLVLVAGRPVGSPEVHELASAVLMAWFPGEEGAEAVAGALTGEFSPSGKLPISWPRSAGQIPVYHGHKVSGGRSHWKGDYVDSPVSPLYPFGHGLSYTTFELDTLSVSPPLVRMDGTVTVSARVANTGPTDGEEVVQLYVRDLEASVTRPISELKGFARVAVPAGESRTVIFTLETGQLGFHDRDLKYVVEPGEFEVSAGTSASNRLPAGRFTIMGDRGSTNKTYEPKIEIQ